MFFIFFYEILIKKFNIFHNNGDYNKIDTNNKIDMKLTSIPEENIEIKIINSNNKSNLGNNKSNLGNNKSNLDNKYKIVNIIDTKYNFEKNTNIDQELKNYIISIV
jgi:hypothetical protein